MNRVYPRHAVNLDAGAFGRYLRLLADGELGEGEQLTAFEKAFAEHLGASACVAVASARAGFYLTLKALEIGGGGEVIMPAYTFPSMPAAVVAAGARPVFVDVDPETYNLDPALAREAASKRTRAIVAAHLFGRAADVESLSAICRENDIALLEDCAHSAGVKSGEGFVGTFGEAGFFSFGIGKNMPCFGGGAVTFSDRETAARVRKLVYSSPPPDHLKIHAKVLGALPPWLLTRRSVFPWTLYIAARVLSSMDSDVMDRSVEEPVEETTKFSLRSLGRMANIQAAVGLDQIVELTARNAKLAANGRRLAEAIRDVPTVKAPDIPPGELEHIYLYFRILVPEADRFRKEILRKGIDTQPDDMRNCAGLEAFSDYAAECPVAAGLPAKSIELPNNTSMTQSDVDYVAEAVRETAEKLSNAKPAGASS